MDWYDYGYFKHSTPRRAKGGIKAQSKQGAFGENWWAKRWIQVLESFNIGARLGRGRSYARSGQVLSIEIGKGRVTANVQGSRPKPYGVEIRLQPLSRQAWQRFVNVLCAQPYFTALLMNGQMPNEIEEVFKKAKLFLFPNRANDLKTECTCPDWSNPCKHIAAVYYLLGEEFDRNPFLIFKLRGIEREELLILVGKNTLTKGKTKIPLASERVSVNKQESVSVQAPLPSEPDVFWGNIDIKNDFLGETTVPAIPAALPKQLGNFPFWKGEQRFLDSLVRMYSEASSVGSEIVSGMFGANEESRAHRSE